MMASPAQPFVSATRVARWSQGLLVACLVLAAVGAVSDFFEFSLLSRRGTHVVSDAERDASDVRQAAIDALQSLVTLATAGAFLTWFYRVHKNLPSLGARNLKYSPGWAIGGFFVPFLNFVRPFQVMREVWRFSYPSALESGGTPEGLAQHPNRPTLALVGWWWGLFLLSEAFGRVSTRIALAGDPSLEQLKLGSITSLISNILDIPTAWLALRVVGHITDWQNKLSSRLPAAPAAAATESL